MNYVSVSESSETVLKLDCALEYFLRICKITSYINQFATFILDDSGMHYKSINENRTCLLEVLIPKESFNTYVIGATKKFTFPVDEIIKKLNKVNKESSFGIVFKDGRAHFFLGNRRQSNYILNLPEDDYWFGGELNVQFKVRLVLEASLLRQICSELSVESSEITLTSDQDTVKFESKSSSSEMYTILNAEQRHVLALEAQGKQVSSYIIDPIIKFLNSLQPKVITIRFTTASPLCISCILPKLNATITLFEAPLSSD